MPRPVAGAAAARAQKGSIAAAAAALASLPRYDATNPRLSGRMGGPQAAATTPEVPPLSSLFSPPFLPSPSPSSLRPFSVREKSFSLC